MTRLCFTLPVESPRETEAEARGEAAQAKTHKSVD